MPNAYKQSFKQAPANTELSVYNCGLQSCAGGHTWGPGIRDHFLIHLVTKGSGIYTVNNKTYTLDTGCLFLVKPNQLALYTASRETPWEYYWVGFNGANAAHLVQQLPFTDDCPTTRAAQPDAAKELLHNIYLAGGNDAHHRAAMTGTLYLFLANLMLQTTEQEKRPPDLASQYVVHAIQFIQFNYSRDIGVDDIANAVGVSRSHLYRVFISNLGQSPIEYLTEFRIREACALLQSSGLTVAEVAYSVGFLDQFYFSRIFKKVKGVPPSRYAQNGTTPETPL